MSVESSASNVERSAPRGAVFLSYASQDAAAVQRICDSLRAAGIEVWFDQNELVGGDQWDAKIRGQISACALFVPVISANTQARTEGYFRLEWKLAAQRTHMIADDAAFLLPVVIDGTRDGEARVPAEFKAVQWTRLPNGENGEAFSARVTKLLEGGAAEPSPSSATGPEAAPRGRPGPTKVAAAPKRSRWQLGAVGALGLMLAVGAWWATTRPSTGPNPGAQPEVSAANSSPAKTSNSAEASRLVAKAWEQMDKTEMARSELLLAEGFCKQAAALDEANPSVWAAWSAMNTWYYFHGFELLPDRKEAARNYALKALAIDPQSYDARYAWAHFNARLALDDPSVDARPALASLRELLREKPDEPRAMFAMGYGLMYDAAMADEGFAILERLAEKHPWFAGRALDEVGWMALFHGRFSLAESAADRAVKAQPYWNNLGLKATLALRLHGDVELAQAMVNRLPLTTLQENWGVALAVLVADWRGDYGRAVSILQGVSRDWLENFFFPGPTSLLSGWMRLKANQVTAAEKDLSRALDLIAARLERTPNEVTQLWLKAETLRLLNRRGEAEIAYRQLLEVWPNALAQVTFENPPQALEYVRRMVRRDYSLVGFPPGWWFTAASLRHDPLLENVRRAPGFAALLREVEEREKQRWAPTPNAGAKAVTLAEPTPLPALPVDQKSVAVLAFANLSDDKGNEYFSDGISEELLNVLAKVPGLKVSARTSAFYFKGKEVPIADLAKQLGVAYVVEGSVRKAGSQVRIAAKLIKAADGFPVWSDTFTRDLKDIFAVQDEIAGLIAQNLKLKLNLGPERGQANPEAYALLLQGRFFARQESNAGRKQSIEFYRRALALEPGYAAAWAEMAQAYIRLARFGGMTTAEGMKEARLAAQKALEFDPDHASALDAMGWVQRTADWDWRAAQKSFQRALALAPENSAILADAGILFRNVGRSDEALVLARRAVERDPLNAMAQINLGDLLMQTGGPRLAESIEYLSRGIKLAPQIEEFRSHLAIALAQLQRFAEAEAVNEQEPNEGYRLWGRGIMAGLRGDRAAVARAREALMAKGDPSMIGYVAMLFAAEGRPDEAFEWVERSVRERDSSVCWIKTATYYESLHSDPRWPVLLRKIGLADDQLK